MCKYTGEEGGKDSDSRMKGKKEGDDWKKTIKSNYQKEQEGQMEEVEACTRTRVYVCKCQSKKERKITCWPFAKDIDILLFFLSKQAA